MIVLKKALAPSEPRRFFFFVIGGFFFGAVLFARNGIQLQRASRSPLQLAHMVRVGRLYLGVLFSGAQSHLAEGPTLLLCSLKLLRIHAIWFRHRRDIVCYCMYAVRGENGGGGTPSIVAPVWSAIMGRSYVALKQWRLSRFHLTVQSYIVGFQAMRAAFIFKVILRRSLSKGQENDASTRLFSRLMK